MDDAENIVKITEELLKRLLPDEKAKALRLFKDLIDRGVAARQETIVLAPDKIKAAAHSGEINSGTYQATNRYDVKGKKLGEGGMGIVYLAFDTQLKREVALKVLKNKDDELIERFMREKEITAELDHPNFVRILTVGDMETPKGSMPFYTMPRIIGDTLEGLLEKRAKTEHIKKEFTHTRLLQIAQQICLTMQSAHDKGIIHRDLKPSNIYVGQYGEVYVMDLGLAKRIKDPAHSGRLEAKVEQRLRRREDKNLTMDSGIGTPYYMAPEQLLAPQAVDHRTDIFGIGGILYTILTGQHPRYIEPEIDRESIDLRRMQALRALEKHGSADVLLLTSKEKLSPDVRMLVEKYLKYDALINGSEYGKFSTMLNECNILPPSKIAQNEKVDRTLDAICMKALEKKPENRYQSCREMWTELQQYIEGRRELILKRSGKDLTKIMSKETLPQALEDFEQAEREVLEALSEQERLGRMGLEERLVLIDLLIGKARIYDQRGESGLIIESVEKAKPLIEAPLRDTQKQYIRLLIMEGLAKFNQQKYDDAKELQLKAINMCKSHPEKRLLVSAYHNYALACTYDFGKRQNPADFSNAKQAFTDCYTLAEKLSDAFSSVHARTMMANLLLEKEEFRAEVKTTLQGALNIAGEDDSLIAEIRTSLSWYHLKAKDYSNAIVQGQSAVIHADKASNQINLHEAKLVLGQAHHHLGDAQQRIANLKPVLAFNYPREPSYPDAVKEFYKAHSLDLAELE